MITVAIAIAIAIAIANTNTIFPIMPGPNANTYVHNAVEGAIKFCWKVLVRDLLST
jgi:hypothetical protein